MKHAALLGMVVASLGWGLDVSKLEPRGYVSDFAGVIDAQSLSALETYAGNVERSTGAQFAIVTVESLEDDPVEEAAVRLFEKWKIGNAKSDEGLLILLAVKDRKNRIEVGYGLEPIITDGDAGEVLRSIRPILRQGDYGGALLAAAQNIGERVAQAKGVTIEGQPVRQRRRSNSDGGGIGGLIALFIFFLIIASIFGGRRGGGRRGGGGAGNLLAGMILGQMLGGGRHRGGGWSHGGFGGAGGGGGWGGGGGGGFGGFGGGSSGGGGASGGW